MPVTVKPGLTSARIDSNGLSAEQEFHVSGAANEYLAITADGIPAYGDTYPLDLGSGAISPRVNNISAKLAIGSDSALNWLVTVSYGPAAGGGGGASGRPQNPQPGDEYFSFNFATETAHVTHALDEVSYGPTPKPFTNLAIGLNDNGEIAGMDILVPIGTLEVHHFFSPEAITQDWLNGIIATSGTVNSAEWYGLYAYEALFVGFSFGTQNQDVVEVIYSFAVRPNLLAADLPQFLDSTGAAIEVSGGKGGWELLWAWNSRAVQATEGGAQVNTFCRGVYVSIVYPENDYSALGCDNNLA